jgi:hypothetical protein
VRDVVVVLTCERDLDDPWAYLRSAIKSFGPLPYGTLAMLCCDGEYRGPRLPGWVIVELEQRQGGNGNTLPTWRAWRAAVEESAGYSPPARILFLEDDVIACRHAIDRAFALGVPSDVALVQYFNAWAFRTHEPGFYRPPPMRFLCNQALCWNRSALERVIETASKAEAPYHRAADTALASVLDELGLTFAVHVPDLFQHTGDSSALTPGERLGARQSSTFPGTGWSAMQLFAAVPASAYR